MQSFFVSAPREEQRADLFLNLSEMQIVLRIWNDEEPYDWDGMNRIRVDEIGDYEYLIYPPYRYEIMEEWFQYGGWRISYPNEISFPVMDTFRMNETMVKRQLDGLGVTFLIDSYYDNIDWKVFYKPDFLH